MEIPQGNTPEDNKSRRQIIKDFYARWMSEHPEKKVWNKSLQAFIEYRPPKCRNNNQKKFSKMLFLKWKTSRVLVGQRKTSGDYELYYISGGQKNKAVR